MPAAIDSPVVHGLEFHYDGSPQRSPQWLAVKRGRIGASSLDKWLAVSKAKASLGKPLKARLDYEKELMFERQFNTSFEHYQNSAMSDGIELEDWAANQYVQITGRAVEEVGCWYNEFFAASPDRKVTDENGGIEIKLLKDNSFTEVLSQKDLLDTNNPEKDKVAAMAELEKTTSLHKHWKQTQGQMWATGWDWVDYVVVNTNSGKVAIVRVFRDQEFIDYLAEAVQEKLVVAEFDTNGVHDIVGEIPTGLVFANSGESDNEASDWSK